MNPALILLASLPSILSVHSAASSPIASTAGPTACAERWSAWNTLRDGEQNGLDMRTETYGNSLMKSGYYTNVEIRSRYKSDVKFRIRVHLTTGVKETIGWTLSCKDTMTFGFDSSRIVAYEVLEVTTD